MGFEGLIRAVDASDRDVVELMRGAGDEDFASHDWGGAKSMSGDAGFRYGSASN